ncbi:MAG: deoxyguanosinetriphosphate triphosphohydrolase [Abitibacteriaceae bacterium]|nr:deoxyguanosinetriphosphate triphosphohydrolase [Abditibacteriaceae bacterium]
MWILHQEQEGQAGAGNSCTVSLLSAHTVTMSTSKSTTKVGAAGGMNGAGPAHHDLEDGHIRLSLEAREHAWLAPLASKVDQSKGRERPEPLDSYRTEWQRDRDRIIHTKAFRRLKHKTQVFISPEQDHYRTRLTHTLEVTQIARTVARALRLNEDLTEAIGMGHDLGHAPFGHIGEESLDEAYRRFDPDSRFRHYEQSLRIVDVLENNGKGLNLTWEVRDGILHHSKGKSDLKAGKSLDLWLQRGKPATLEGQIVRICDRVAYVNHDIDDAIRSGMIHYEDLPKDCLEVLGQRHAQRITTMVNAIIEASSEVVATEHDPLRQALDRIAMRDDIMHATDTLKNWMFDHVYLINTADEAPRVRNVIHHLFEHFMSKPQLMRGEYANLCPAGQDVDSLTQPALARCVCDYIAGMTDRFASQIYTQLFMPSSWRGV